MDLNTFRSAAFGGFVKQDVIDYSEKTAREATTAQEQLRQANDRLTAQCATYEEELKTLRQEHAELEQTAQTLRQELEQESSARAGLEGSHAQAHQLQAEVDRLKPDAEAYVRFRESIGSIEFEARKRAADLEDETLRRIATALQTTQVQYQTRVSTFHTAAAHVTGELRKVEVNLSQLPRSLDQVGVEMDKMNQQLDEAKKNQKT